MVNTVVSHSPLEIIKPLPDSSVHIGAPIDVTIKISRAAINNSKQVLLGFGLNSEDSRNPKSLGDVFLGVLNTTQTPFDPTTGELSWSSNTLSKDELNPNSKFYSLVISHYMFSGPLHTPHCVIVSVPIRINHKSWGSDPVGHAEAKNASGSALHCSDQTGCFLRTKPDHSSRPATQSPPTSKDSTISYDHGRSHYSSHLQVSNQDLKASLLAKGHITARVIPGAAPNGNSTMSSERHAGQESPAPHSSSKNRSSANSTAEKSNHTQHEPSPADSSGGPKLKYLTGRAMVAMVLVVFGSWLN